MFVVFFFKQKTAYEVRISDWSSDVCSSDLLGNADRLRRARGIAAEAGADLVVFTELAICGYPPEDLVLKPFFQDRVEAAVHKLAAETADGGPEIGRASCRERVCQYV